MDNIPKSRLYSITQLSKITGKDRATIASRLQDLKTIKEDGRSKFYDTVEALQIIYAAESFRGMQKKIEQVGYEIEKEKLAKIRTENETQMGKLVPIEEVVKTVQREYSFVNAQIKSLPSKLSKPLSMETDPAVINHLLTDSINECLQELTAVEHYKKYIEELQKVDNERETEAKSTSDGTTDMPTDSIKTKD